MEQVNHKPATPLLDALQFRSYAWQRYLSPHISPERWARIYDHGEELEARYQQEKCQTCNALAEYDGTFCFACAKAHYADEEPMGSECRVSVREP